MYLKSERESFIEEMTTEKSDCTFRYSQLKLAIMFLSIILLPLLTLLSIRKGYRGLGLAIYWFFLVAFNTVYGANDLIFNGVLLWIWVRMDFQDMRVLLFLYGHLAYTTLYKYMEKTNRYLLERCPNSLLYE